MKPLFLMLASAAVLAACTTTNSPNIDAVTPPTQTMSEAEFSARWNNAYNADPKPSSETLFADLLARNDLSATQRGRAYYGRGTIRGIWVRDWAEAYPQCALGDFLKAVEYPMSDAQFAQTSQAIRYQYDRRIYFPNRLEECEPNVAAAKTWLESRPAG